MSIYLNLILRSLLSPFLHQVCCAVCAAHSTAQCVFHNAHICTEVYVSTRTSCVFASVYDYAPRKKIDYILPPCLFFLNNMTSSLFNFGFLLSSSNSGGGTFVFKPNLRIRPRTLFCFGLSISYKHQAEEREKEFSPSFHYIYIANPVIVVLDLLILIR